MERGAVINAVTALSVRVSRFELTTMAKPKGPALSTTKKARTSGSAFDVWLQRGLHEIYDKVANEPIPDDLLKMIDDDRKRDEDGNK